MSLRTLIERVLNSGLLSPELVAIPPRGASEAELASIPTLPNELRDLLAWRNGLDLEVIRLHGIGIGEWQITHMATREGLEVVVFASDPAGFQYYLAQDGVVMCYDHDGGEISKVAENVKDFLRNYIFGIRAAEFGGEKWANEVAAARHDNH